MIARPARTPVETPIQNAWSLGFCSIPAIMAHEPQQAISNAMNPANPTRMTMAVEAKKATSFSPMVSACPVRFLWTLTMHARINAGVATKITANPRPGANFRAPRQTAIKVMTKNTLANENCPTSFLSAPAGDEDWWRFSPSCVRRQSQHTLVPSSSDAPHSGQRGSALEG